MVIEGTLVRTRQSKVNAATETGGSPLTSTFFLQSDGEMPDITCDTFFDERVPVCTSVETSSRLYGCGEYLEASLLSELGREPWASRSHEMRLLTASPPEADEGQEAGPSRDAPAEKPKPSGMCPTGGKGKLPEVIVYPISCRGEDSNMATVSLSGNMPLNVECQGSTTPKNLKLPRGSYNFPVSCTIRKGRGELVKTGQKVDRPIEFSFDHLEELTNRVNVMGIDLDDDKFIAMIGAAAAAAGLALLSCIAAMCGCDLRRMLRGRTLEDTNPDRVVLNYRVEGPSNQFVQREIERDFLVPANRLTMDRIALH